ncbi:MAG: purine-nucleoside phosphorylase [Desulfobulbaceae bacterium]|nr:purine-nucleoside phosphorylase [Desulfobulbaceae bacterium]
MIDSNRHRQQVEEAVSFLRDRMPAPPEIVIVLGTGLCSLADSLIEPFALPYKDIPWFPVSTVTSHEGNLVSGILNGKPVAILQGRVHCYEGYSAREAGLPMRVLSLLGARTAIITNASGGLNPEFTPGAIMVLTDHINLLGDNPLRGANIEEWGPRFPDLSKPYDHGLVLAALEAGEKLGLENVRRGTYICVPGPTLETPAETRFFRQSGADAIGMSSIPEILVALHAGMKVLGLSVVANINDPDNLQPILLEEIVETAARTEPLLQKLVFNIIPRC